MSERPSIVGPVIAGVVGLAGLIAGFVRVEREQYVFDGRTVGWDDTCSIYDTNGDLLKSGQCSSMADLVTNTEPLSLWLSFCGGVVLLIAAVMIVRRLTSLDY